jgi:hypothetical protein
MADVKRISILDFDLSDKPEQAALMRGRGKYASSFTTSSPWRRD